MNNKAIRFVAATGNGDQYIFIDKGNNIVIVATGGNYNNPVRKNAYSLLRDYIYPAIVKK